MEFTHYQQKAIDCIACQHGIPTRAVRFVPHKDGYVVVPASAKFRDRVVRFNTQRLAARLTRALRV